MAGGWLVEVTRTVVLEIPAAAREPTARRAKEACSVIMKGASYLERGQPVTVLARGNWKRPEPVRCAVIWLRSPRRLAPRNVLIERADGSLVVRPFRGLRKPKEAGRG